ncbi:NAD(P)H-dependent oxidoreductase [Candidatus Tokpelaia sp.]|uniref:NAD(P)H-dependent oxidoreductase n=1 Tax=Candidatus Tokpelaia sp. TaxID=2233777 RepID=UPI00123B45B1|nr:Gfo/Idh/MocA family oxidoreductase [Candidatus Tokpelaia sp.]KAA6405408.1 homoserine dehydrogenase [Candidatus Tokpelaia sp.]
MQQRNWADSANVALTGLAYDLAEREKAGKPIQIGLVGCGEMGTDLLTRVAHMQGVRVGAVVARNPERALAAGEIAWQEKGHVRLVENAAAMTKAIEQGVSAAGNDLDLVLANPLIDIIVDATGDPEAGAEIGFKALENGKHVVMMNVEADVTIGPYLKFMADKAGLIYTLGAGDEPSACMELIEFIAAQGHKIIAAGKGKNNPLIIHATPDMYEEEAARRNMNVRMLVEFIDGSKTMVEMAAIANATGLTIDCPGMHGVNAPLDRLNKVLVPKAEGGVLRQTGVVDYSTGKGVAPGVFVVAEMRHPRIWERMEDLKIGQGPYFTFYRPYHLTAMEVPLSCARAILYGKADMVPLMQRSAEVCAVAKRDLAAGEELDFIGLYTYRAFTLTVAQAQARRAIPCGLLRGARITAPIKAGELITKANCTINPEQWIARLRKEQDKLLNGQ